MKEETGTWYEEYDKCHCSMVTKYKRELLGYCEKHGTSRKYLWKLPKPIKIG